LHLGNTGIDDLSFFENNLSNLATLILNDNQLTAEDLNSLTGINLSVLNLDGNIINNIESLTDITTLTNLSLGDNNISDISPLKELTSLTQLNLANNNIKDIRVLNGLASNLTALDLSGNTLYGSAEDTTLNIKWLDSFNVAGKS